MCCINRQQKFKSDFKLHYRHLRFCKKKKKRKKVSPLIHRLSLFTLKRIVMSEPCSERIIYYVEPFQFATMEENIPYK